MIVTIQKAAQHYKIASLHIHTLIMRGHIVRCIQSAPGMTEPQIMVDTTELDRYFHENPAQLDEWQQKFQKAEEGNRL